MSLKTQKTTLQFWQTILLVIVALATSNDARAETYYTDIKRLDGCVAYFPDHYDNTIKWSGTCKDGLADGIVTFTIEDKPKKYSANFRSGYVYGVVSLGSTDYSYSCNYERSVASGICVTKSSDTNYTAKYEGGNEREGAGFKPFLLGGPNQGRTRQEGEFLGGKLHGFGRVMVPSTFTDRNLSEFEQASNQSLRYGIRYRAG